MPKKIAYHPDAKLWERMEGETTRSYELFHYYAMLGGERTLRETAEYFGINRRYCQLLSANYSWRERAAAWDEEVLKKARAAKIKEVEDMTKRHTRQAMIIQRVLLLPAEALLKKTQNNPSVFDNMPEEKLLDKVIKSTSALSDVVDIERKSRGEPTEIAQTDVTTGGEAVRLILPIVQKPNNDDN